MQYNTCVVLQLYCWVGNCNIDVILLLGWYLLEYYLRIVRSWLFEFDYLYCNNFQKRIPPPMYKRETRFKGQKRVSVGRVTRNNDPSESRDSSRESSCEDSSRMIKCEPNFNDGSADVAVSSVQVSELIYWLEGSLLTKRILCGYNKIPLSKQ